MHARAARTLFPHVAHTNLLVGEHVHGEQHERREGTKWCGGGEEQKAALDAVGGNAVVQQVRGEPKRAGRLVQHNGKKDEQPQR